MDPIDYRRETLLKNICERLEPGSFVCSGEFLAEQKKRIADRARRKLPVEIEKMPRNVFYRIIRRLAVWHNSRNGFDENNR